jgi:hypothetical protein
MTGRSRPTGQIALRQPVLSHILSVAFGRQFVLTLSVPTKPQASLLPVQDGDRRIPALPNDCILLQQPQGQIKPSLTLATHAF